MYVAEATGGRWLHVRIDYREYSIPLGVAEGVLIEVPEVAEPPSAGDAYAVLVSRLDRRSWRVRMVDRSTGVVVRSEWFEQEAAARRRHDELSADAASLDAAAFRSRYRLRPDPGGAGSRRGCRARRPRPGPGAGRPRPPLAGRGRWRGGPARRGSWAARRGRSGSTSAWTTTCRDRPTQRARVACTASTPSTDPAARSTSSITSGSTRSSSRARTSRVVPTSTQPITADSSRPASGSAAGQPAQARRCRRRRPGWPARRPASGGRRPPAGPT